MDGQSVEDLEDGVPDDDFVVGKFGHEDFDQLGESGLDFSWEIYGEFVDYSDGCERDLEILIVEHLLHFRADLLGVCVEAFA